MQSDNQEAPAPEETAAAREVEQVLSAVRGHDWDANRRAAEALAGTGRPAVPRLVEALGDEDGYVREAAARALGKIGDERAVNPLVAAMRHRDGRVYEDDEDAEARLRAALALGEIGDAGAFDALVEAISDDDPQLAWYAVEALGMLGDPRALPHLISAIQYPDVDRRKAARSALVRIGEPAVPPLAEALRDASGNWRLFAIRALGVIGDARALDTLRGLLAAPDEHIRAAAHEAVEKILAHGGG